MYLIIGSGRTALHFRHYFKDLKIPHLTWSRKENSAEDLKQKLAQAQKILVLISDSQIEAFARETLSATPAMKIHFSGALNIPGMLSAHPLMSFGPELYSLDFYRQIYFAVSPDADFHSLFPELPNPSFKLKAEDKSTYHAWAAYSGNLAALLWKESLPAWTMLGVPSDAIHMYLAKTLQNSIRDPLHAPTGALVRKDQVTLNKHLSVLPPRAKSIYQNFIANSEDKI